MTTIVLPGLTLLLIWTTTTSNNPLKTSFFMLISVSLMFLYLKMTTGTSWIPLVLFILFSGGILLLFMILASVLPNQKSMKIKISKTTSLLIILGALLHHPFYPQSTTASQMTAFLTSHLNLFFMSAVILMYFFQSMSLNTAEEYSMRSLMC